MDRYFKIILVLIGVALWMVFFRLWLYPKEVRAEDIDIESRLSYISKIVGSIESSVIKIEGDLRFVKRQTNLSAATVGLSEKRLNALEKKINIIEGLVDSIDMDMTAMGGDIAYIESDLDGLVSGSCNNIFLCRQKKY